MIKKIEHLVLIAFMIVAARVIEAVEEQRLNQIEKAVLSGETFVMALILAACLFA